MSFAFWVLGVGLRISNQQEQKHSVASYVYFEVKAERTHVTELGCKALALELRLKRTNRNLAKERAVSTTLKSSFYHMIVSRIFRVPV